MGLKDPRTKEFVAGLLSASVSVSVTFPITKLIYRQIITNSSLITAILGVKKDGIRYLYRGMMPPLFQRSTEISVMFGVYKSAELALHPLKLSMYDEKVASSTMAGIVESVLTPFERTQLLLMDSRNHNRFKNFFHLLLIVSKDYGPKEFYRGYTAIVVRDICHNTFFFLVKDKLSGLIKLGAGEVSLHNFLVGASVGLLMTWCFHPLKVLKADMQKQLGGRFKPIYEVAGEVYSYKGRGLINFYRGLGVNMVRAMLGWGMTNTSYEFIRKRI